MLLVGGSQISREEASRSSYVLDWDVQVASRWRRAGIHVTKVVLLSPGLTTWDPSSLGFGCGLDRTSNSLTPNDSYMSWAERSQQHDPYRTILDERPIQTAYLLKKAPLYHHIKESVVIMSGLLRNAMCLFAILSGFFHVPT
jgi:hypothetical protein